MSRLCFLLASPAKEQMEQKFRIKNTISGILIPVCLFVCWECRGRVSVKRLFKTLRASAFKGSRVYNTVARQVPRSIAPVVNQSSP